MARKKPNEFGKKLTSVNHTRMTVLNLLKEGHYPAQIASMLGISRQAVSKHIKRLLQEGLIVKSILSQKGVCDYYDVNDVSTKTSLCVRRPKRVENWRIKIPILQDNPEFKGDYEMQDGFGRWVRKYVKNLPLDMTLEKTTKNVILHCHPREYENSPKFYSELAMYSMKVVMCAFEYMKNRGVIINPMKAEDINMEIATVMPEQNDKVQPSTEHNLFLNRNAQGVFGMMKAQAKVRMERSHGDVEIESNDLNYDTKLMMMPETVDRLAGAFSMMDKSLKLYNQEIKSHLAVVQSIDIGIKEFNKTVAEFANVIRRMKK